MVENAIIVIISILSLSLLLTQITSIELPIIFALKASARDPIFLTNSIRIRMALRIFVYKPFKFLNLRVIFSLLNHKNYFTHGLSYRIVGLNTKVTIYGVVCLMLKN
jgi:hypothetical protein